MITLPEAFEQEMKQLLGEGEYEAYRKTFDGIWVMAFWVSTASPSWG